MPPGSERSPGADNPTAPSAYFVPAQKKGGGQENKTDSAVKWGGLGGRVQSAGKREVTHGSFFERQIVHLSDRGSSCGLLRRPFSDPYTASHLPRGSACPRPLLIGGAASGPILLRTGEPPSESFRKLPLSQDENVSRPHQCKAFAPGSIGNLACGFDVLGLALDGPGDEVTATLVPEPGSGSPPSRGTMDDCPLEVSMNTAGTAALAVLDEVGTREGVEIQLRKGLPLAAGMGGSAASAVAAAVAVDHLLGNRLPREVLLRCALAGEAVASGGAHPDNAAPSLLGGLVLVPVWEPLRAIELEVPRELYLGPRPPPYRGGNQGGPGNPRRPGGPWPMR